jgi:hypothetical protein
MTGPLSPPHPDRPGKWRCCLCDHGWHTTWRRGTLRDALDHYLTMHTKETTR